LRIGEQRCELLVDFFLQRAELFILLAFEIQFVDYRWREDLAGRRSAAATGAAETESGATTGSARTALGHAALPASAWRWSTGTTTITLGRPAAIRRPTRPAGTAIARPHLAWMSAATWSTVGRSTCARAAESAWSTSASPPVTKTAGTKTTRSAGTAALLQIFETLLLLSSQNCAELVVDVLLEVGLFLLLFGSQLERFDKRGRHDLAGLWSAAKTTETASPQPTTSAGTAVRRTHAACPIPITIVVCLFCCPRD
jgi:hypothetical protein